MWTQKPLHNLPMYIIFINFLMGVGASQWFIARVFPLLILISVSCIINYIKNSVPRERVFYSLRISPAQETCATATQGEIRSPLENPHRFRPRRKRRGFLSLKNYSYMLWSAAIFILGYGWGDFYQYYWHSQTLPKKLINKTITIKGVVASIPQQDLYHTQFNFYWQSIRDHRVNQIIRLAWYHHSPIFHVGQQWILTVKLKPPHGLHNVVGFNKEAWALQNHIIATGYVKARGFNHYLRPTQLFLLSQWRERLKNKITQGQNQSALIAIIEALTIGSRADFTSQLWQVFQATGTSHLVAISGLHVGLVAGLAWTLALFLWRILGGAQFFPASRFAAIVSILVALSYTLLSGLGFPALRTIIMLFILMSRQLIPWFLNLWDRILLALVIIVLLDPLSLSSASFILSFSAVAIIAYVVSYRLHLTKWQQWWRLQLGITLLLLPVTLWFFQQYSLISLFVNLLAIPWVGFLVVPISLLACLFIYLYPPLGHKLIILAAYILKPLWKLLIYLSQQNGMIWQYSINLSVMLIVLFSLLIIFMPRGWPGRSLAWVGLLPLFFWHPPRPPLNAVWMTLLDVGQGLAIVLQTHRHLIIYDTGPRYPHGFNAGESVLTPYLHYLHFTKINLLIVSHGDNDHSGGASALLRNFKVQRILTSIPQRFPGAEFCRAGQHWQWDGVNFNVLSPLHGQPYADNNSSCVLRVSVGKQAILLPGDIEAATEQQMLAKIPRQTLHATVLVAPHHGSNTSSTMTWLRGVKPKFVLFSTGYINRFHFPRVPVLRRYQQIGAKSYNTALNGMINVRMERARMIRLTPFLSPRAFHGSEFTKRRAHL